MVPPELVKAYAMSHQKLCGAQAVKEILKPYTHSTKTANANNAMRIIFLIDSGFLLPIYLILLHKLAKNHNGLLVNFAFNLLHIITH